MNINTFTIESETHDPLALLQLLDRLVDVALHTVARVERVVDCEHARRGARELVLEAIDVTLQLGHIRLHAHDLLNRVDELLVVGAAHAADLALLGARVRLETC